MLAFNFPFPVILNAVKDLICHWKHQPIGLFTEINPQKRMPFQEKLQSFFEALMLLFFPLFFTYLSDIYNNINNNKQTSNFLLTYRQAFHSSKMTYFRRRIHVAWC